MAVRKEAIELLEQAVELVFNPPHPLLQTLAPGAHPGWSNLMRWHQQVPGSVATRWLNRAAVWEWAGSSCRVVRLVRDLRLVAT